MSRTEADRRQKMGVFESMIRRPEIGAFAVMIIVLIALGLASDAAYSPLGIRNNTRIVAQLGIIAIGAFMLMVAGEFDFVHWVNDWVRWDEYGLDVEMGFAHSNPVHRHYVGRHGRRPAIDRLSGDTVLHTDVWVFDRQHRCAQWSAKLHCDLGISVFPARFDRSMFPLPQSGARRSIGFNPSIRPARLQERH